MLHLAVESAFDDLLATWRAHQSRQTQQRSTVSELAHSRLTLDRARHRMHKLRTTIYPDADELESIVETVWCETLETVVHLRWTDRHHTHVDNFACACGRPVPVDSHALRRRNE